MNLLKLLTFVVLATLLLLVTASYSQTPATIPAVPDLHGHSHYVTTVELLRYVLGFLAANALVVLGGAIFVGRRLERMDDHSKEIEAHTTELARISASQTEMLVMISEIRGGILGKTASEK